jgi:hypothetical protein
MTSNEAKGEASLAEPQLSPDRVAELAEGPMTTSLGSRSVSLPPGSLHLGLHGRVARPVGVGGGILARQTVWPRRTSTEGSATLSPDSDQQAALARADARELRARFERLQATMGHEGYARRPLTVPVAGGCGSGKNHYRSPFGAGEEMSRLPGVRAE